MSGTSYATSEAIGTKIWALETEAIYEDDKKNAELHAQERSSKFWVKNSMKVF